ncbi:MULTISPECIES: heme biosynthesis protein HemY [unclassified Mesorhizobium]|uniref:heme biosynthesis protein HemY n=2 Tax=Mesorhizobium TaxID=68287 RepID=UPI0007ECD4DC|nr:MULTISPECIES: heme biosynthesis protein HemY [unclassified Mesorhizobium]QIA21177.1 heme biosynthesis protein HemY [Mesorhizobium sp. AA22]RUV55065.1 heme biosynthesis protein HemY [Mesorhizobium sp. M5C.F.Ca.IN.020.29.1.1]RWG42684.1 MAG: heme biosynthesis protein HemY [Mesorhizobium sp.]RWH54082.1 MAG: heme biosynthesis protein HemY [Mesorhizobium sp.]RWI68524.1 MAG: heme biosynthesis protein HemY [Mesorhizobium sp.]
MIRILLFLAVVFVLGLGFAWLADRPGEMVVTFSGYQYQVSLMVAAVAVVAVVAAVMIVWWLLKALWNSPYTISRYFRVRRRDRGYQALSTGMIAAGAGDGALARKKTKEAAKLIRSDQEPLIHLLEAQASLLEGDHEGAREKFETMLDDPEMRLLGLRGLYLEAERLGDRNAARHYAGRAAAMAPQLAWAAESTLEDLTGRGDWDGALKLVEAQKSTRQIERDAANRRRAVLLTAKAQALIDSDPNAAKTAALEANRLRPDFAPAAVIAAKLLFRQNDVRKGAKILEAAWKAEPHPEIAELYTHARPGDAVLDRLNRAKKLQEMKKNHAESSLAVARAALDAQDFSTARKEAEAAIRMDRREGAYLLLADIEEAETGDQGKIRQLLSKAVRAPRDPAWVADGVVSERWAPVSPITGKLDAFEWRAPMERLGQLIDSDEDAPDAAVPTIAGPIEPAKENVIELNPAGSAERPTAAAASESGEDDVAPVNATAFAAVPPDAEAVEPAEELARLPDDPGVDPDDQDQKSPRKFRLF